ncbi:TniB family NTP-binding protein [Paracoccus cavernae]|uniref:TniB family NTP-binding protein n=1 Tax=Paracoccus cavernae TaxID=1571207 RepID=UPI0035F2B56B
MLLKERTSSASASPDLTDLPSRLAWLDDRYLRNARDEAFEEGLREIIKIDADGKIIPEPVRDPLTGETKGFAVIGNSGDGKSAMIRRNLARLEGFRERTPQSDGNYLAVNVPPEATIKSLATDILAKTGYGKVASSAKAHELWKMVRHRLIFCGISLLWIDEAHHLLRGGAGRDLAGALQALKKLMQEESGVAVIVSGIPKLRELLLTDPETSRRFKWQRLRPVGAASDDAINIARFVTACCKKIGLRPPADPHFAERLIFASHEGLGLSLALAKDSLRRALTARDSQLTLDHARRTWELQHPEHEGLGPFAAIGWPDLKKSLVDAGWA